MKLALSAASLAVPAQANDAWIWPLPQSMSAQGSAVPLAKQFKFSGTDGSDILSNAAARYEGYLVANATSDMNALQSCSVSVGGMSEGLVANTSYKYSLKLSGGSCDIKADTVFGAMYGMESLYQLAANGTLPNSDIDIEDFPDFDHRGIMIDTGRRFWPKTLVKNVIDVMSFNKLNVLHMHLSDMCRVGVESKVFPELTGSLGGIKAGHHTQEDVTDLIAYGKQRGVRIVPEFDMPGHAASFLPMEPRGVEVCNRPGESSTPNWCTLKAGNGTAAWDLMPQLALEMAQLFGSEIYHIGGDETRCGGSGQFEAMLLEKLEEAGFRTMGWSEIQGVMRNSTIIHSWKGGDSNATSLAAKGIASIDSNPSRFYRGGGKTVSTVTQAWSDLDKASVPEENQHLLLGGEYAFWTDAYSYINDCTRPGSPPGGGHELFGPDKDEEFSRSAAGYLWPFGSLAAGSFWHYDATVDVEEIRLRATRRQNTLASWRGGQVCPTDCECTMTSICGEPLVPAPPPSPPAPSSKACVWKSDTVLDGTDLQTLDLQSKEECCAACENAEGCAASVFDPLTKVCRLKEDFTTMTYQNDGSLVCIPRTTTTTTASPTMV